MERDEKDILKNLKAKSDAFKMPVTPDLWDAIEKDIKADQSGSRKGLWWKIVSGLGALGLLLGIVFYAFGRHDFAQLERQALMGQRAWVNSKSISPDSLAQLAQIKGQADKDDIHKPYPKTTQEMAAGGVEKQDGDVSNTHKESISSSLKEWKSNEHGYPTVTDPINKGIEEEQKTGVFPLATENRTAVPQGDLEISYNDSLEAGNNEELLTESNGSGLPADSLLVEKAEKNKKAQSDTIGFEKIEDAYSKFRLIAIGGFGSSFRTLKSSTHHTLITHKNEHESAGNAFDFGLSGQFNMSKKMFLRMGLSYQFFSDKYDFQHDLITHTTKNDYQYLQIPITFGWEFLSFKRSGLSVLAGVGFNRLYSAQSSWVDPITLEPVLHNNLGSSTPFRKWGVGFGLAIDYRFKLSEKWYLHFVPGIDVFSSSVYKRSTDLYQRPYSLNLDAGISYSF